MPSRQFGSEVNKKRKYGKLMRLKAEKISRTYRFFYTFKMPCFRQKRRSRDPLTMEQQEDIDRIIDALKETLSEPESEINKTMH